MEIVPDPDETAAHIRFGDVMAARSYSIGDPRQAEPDIGEFKIDDLNAIP